MKLSTITLTAMAALQLLACSDLPTAPDSAVRLNATVVQSSSVVVGAPSNTQIRFPFGGALSSFGGTRYQQAYAAAAFNSTQPIRIDRISFLNGQGTLAASTYSFYLSTISAGIDNLSETDFDANRGANTVLFATVQLSGAAPVTLTIVGDAPFEYDPTQGDLLLDIVISPRATVPSTPAFYAGRSDAFGVFSRYQNFGFGSIGNGLVTEFGLVHATPNEPPPELTMSSLLTAVDEAIADGTLEGRGQGSAAAQVLSAWRNMLSAAQQALDNGDAPGACAPLQQAYLRADGSVLPPDFVQGDAAAALAAMIADLRTALECS